MINKKHKHQNNFIYNHGTTLLYQIIENIFATILFEEKNTNDMD